MEELLRNIENIVDNQLFESVDSFINKLIELNISKESIKVYKINNETKVSIVLPDSFKTIDISISLK